MKKWLLSLCMMLALAACDDKKSSEQAKVNGKPVVRIGASLPLSGDMAETGKNLQAAMKLALQDEAAKQNLKYEYELIFEDDQYDVKKALSNWNMFKSVKHIDVIMTLWGTMGGVASDFALKNKIIHMSCGLSSTVAQGFYNFNNAAKIETHVAKMVDFYKSKGVKDLGIVAYQCAEIDEFIPVLKQKLEENGINVVSELKVNSTDMDLTIPLAKMKEHNPDMLHVQLIPPQAGIFAKTLKKLEWNIEIGSLNDLLLSAEFFDGAYIFQDDTGTEEFIKHFEEATGQRVIGCTANFYDNVRLVIDAYEGMGDGYKAPGHEEITSYILHDYDFKSSFKEFYIDDNGHINTSSIVKQLKDGQLIDVDETKIEKIDRTEKDRKLNDHKKFIENQQAIEAKKALKEQKDYEAVNKKKGVK